MIHSENTVFWAESRPPYPPTFLICVSEADSFPRKRALGPFLAAVHILSQPCLFRHVSRRRLKNTPHGHTPAQLLHTCAFFCVFERMQTCKHVVFVCGGVMALAQLERVISSSQYNRVSLPCALGEPTTNQIVNLINTSPHLPFPPVSTFDLLSSVPHDCCFPAVCWWRSAVACCSQMTSLYSQSGRITLVTEANEDGALALPAPAPCPRHLNTSLPPHPAPHCYITCSSGVAVWHNIWRAN